MGMRADVGRRKLGPIVCSFFVGHIDRSHSAVRLRSRPGLHWAAQLLADSIAPTPAASSGPAPRKHAKRHRAAWNVGVRKA
jgi:hypothetical protein